MAKILVADDNSNIQKMVGLALKDQGIEVVAVGNGEAAVRKISDLRPDLVLADVFMPVRNGYEVCKFVKEDSGLAHIPVILLVGAFDPLDEQEAQRVGADGVLKKPFVPPDPLISMVKSALTRAGVSLAGGNADKTPKPSELKGMDLLIPRAPAAPSAAGPESHGEMGVPLVEGMSFVDEASPEPTPLKISSGAPLAFGSLLDTPAAQEEQEEEDAGYIPTVHPELASERDWRDPDAEQEEVEAEEEEPKAAWRRDGNDEEFVESETGESEGAWRESSSGHAGGRKTPVEPWTPTKEKTGFVEAAEVAEVVEAKVPPPVFHEAAPAAREAATIEARPSIETPAVNASETAPARTGEKSVANTWFSATSSPWDTEAQKANKLASTWDTAVATHPAPAETHETNGSKSASAGETATLDDVSSDKERQAVDEYARKALAEAAVETIREQTPNTKNEGVPGQETSAKETQAEPAPSMDELVAKVLSKMNPEVLQAVTREILKPVVEAIVRDELGAKKQ